MVKHIVLSAVLLLAVSCFSSESKAATKNAQVKASASAKIEVYYFHFTRRCTTCQAVETESKAAISSLYSPQLKDGSITFKSVNLDDKTNAALAKRCKVDGQALLILGAGKRIDLTEQGFMFATTKPDRLKADLKKSIDPLLHL